MIDNPLTNILIRPNIISPKGIREIVEHIKKSTCEDLSVFDPQTTNKTGEKSWQVDKSARDTQTVPMENLFPKIEELLRHTVKKVINPFLWY